MLNKFFVLASALLLGLVTGCAPKLEESKREASGVPFGSRYQDVILSEFADSEFAKENMINEADTKNRLKQVEAMLDISTAESKSDWRKKATKQFDHFEKEMTATIFDSSQSIYLNLVYKHINQEVNSSVDGASKKITSDSEKVINLVREKQNAMMQLNPESLLIEKLKQTGIFLTSLTNEVKKMNLLPEFKSTFLAQLQEQSSQLLGETQQLDENLVRAKTIEESLKIITGYLEKTETHLGAEDQASLETGRQLANVLANLTDEAAGLQAIALVWAVLDGPQRETYFKEASPDLYVFLADKSPDDIQCLTEKNCKGIKSKIVLSLGVYPAINKFGLKNIGDLINQKGHDFVTAKVNHVAFESLQKIGEMITDKILSSVAQKKIDLSQFKDQLRNHLSSGLDSEFTRLGTGAMHTLLTDVQNSVLDLESQTLYLRSKIKLLPLIEKKNQQLRNQFEIVETITLLPLFSKSPNEGLHTLQNELVDLISNPVERQYMSSIASTSTDVKLKNQSALLMTTALALKELVDWKKTSFDQGLSTIQASRIITQFKSKSLSQSFFSKSDLIAIVLSISSQTLKLMQSEYSPLVLVNNDNQVVPVQKLADENSGPIALAAATDFKLGKRIQEVKTSDLSEFLSALMQFYTATEGIEQTQAEFLKKSDAQGKSLLGDLIEARKTIKKLMIATANFISNQIIQVNGLVSKSISLTENLKPLDKYNLIDQTRAIESLVRAYELSDIDAYLWTARDIYYSMNRLLFSSKNKFYQQSTTNEIQSGVNQTVLLETYKSLLVLKPYLNHESQLQLEKIYEPWLSIPLTVL